MMKILFLTLLGLLGSFMPLPQGLAYTDQITVKAEEAWHAAQDVLKPYGISKINEKSGIIETKWIRDRVLRKGTGVFKNITSETLERRYRLTVRVTQRPFDTEIEIRGIFQTGAMAPTPTSISWKKIRPKTEDRDLERAVFMRILNRLELARTNP